MKKTRTFDEIFQKDILVQTDELNVQKRSIFIPSGHFCSQVVDHYRRNERYWTDSCLIVLQLMLAGF